MEWPPHSSTTAGGEWCGVAWRLGKGRCIIITAIISVVGANTFRGALHLNAVKDRAV